jgi:hypothetical protein
MVLFFMVAISGDVYTQEKGTPEKEKYDFYRKRLKEQFMYYSQNPDEIGSHLPVELIKVDKDGVKTAYWADATWWQGHYIAMLALEYAVFKEQNIPTDSTLQELRWAVATLKRLDRNAESYWNGKDTVNGFFLRDDIPDYRNVDLNVDIIDSDYESKLGDTLTLSNAPSQDQIWACYLGFSLVVKLVDDTELVNDVTELAKNFVSCMQHTDVKGNKSWEIVNPVTGQLIQKSGDIKWLQHGHVLAAEYITNMDFHFGKSDNLWWRTVWNFVKNNCLIAKKGNFTWYGIYCCSVVGNDWGRGADNCYDWIRLQCEKIVDMRPDLYQNIIFPHLPLIAAILHGYDGDNPISASVYESYLSSAPEQGGYHIREGGKVLVSDEPWHSLSLFCPWHLNDYGYFNMLDYMLLYNAYNFVYKMNKPEFEVFSKSSN